MGWNGKVSRHLSAYRQELFERLDCPALKPLPAASYVYAEWKQCRAGLDYHVDIGRHYYSVPHQLLKQELWARITARTVEVYFKWQRVMGILPDPERQCGSVDIPPSIRLGLAGAWIMPPHRIGRHTWDGA
jgi:hypothetical protein